jgi:hypothetical protein
MCHLCARIVDVRMHVTCAHDSILERLFAAHAITADVRPLPIAVGAGDVASTTTTAAAAPVTTTTTTSVTTTATTTAVKAQTTTSATATTTAEATAPTTSMRVITRAALAALHVRVTLVFDVNADLAT